MRYNIDKIVHWHISSVKHFHFTDNYYLSCKNVRNTSYIIKILYIGGIVYILEQMFGSENQAICSIHTSTSKIKFIKPIKPPKITKTTSIPTSTNPTKIKHFTTFHITKNHHYTTLKYPQTLENKAFPRTQPKISYLTTK